MARVAVNGDSCGGSINASGRSTINGTPIAFVGDSITPHGPSNSIHRSARIVSGSDTLRIGGKRPTRSGDYATCGHTVSASNSTDDTSVSWAPQPPPAVVSVTPQEGELDIAWGQGEAYPGHYGSIVQWKGPGEEYDVSRQFETGLGSSAFAHTITGLTAGVEYTVRVIATRRFAENAVPSAEVTGIPLAPPPPVP